MAASSDAVVTIAGQTYTGPVAQDIATKEARKSRLYTSRLEPGVRFKGAAAVADAPDTVLAEFNRAGFVVVDGLVDEETVKQLQSSIFDLCASLDPQVASFEPGYSPSSTDTAEERASHVRKICNYRRLVHTSCEAACGDGEGTVDPEVVAASRVLCSIGDCEAIQATCRLLAQDDAIHLVQEMALVKRRGCGGEKPPHVDGAYFLMSRPDRLVGCWLAADPATADNGCMFFLPGSHTAPRFREAAGAVGPPHHALLDCQVPDSLWDAPSAVCAQLRPGDAVFFSGLTVHATPPNLSGDDRGALQVHYASASCAAVSAAAHREMYSGFACIHPQPLPGSAVVADATAHE